MPLTFHVLTYNVAEKEHEKAVDLEPLLGLDKQPDLISIGLEEVSDDSWVKEFGRLITNKGYYLVGKEELFHIRILVYVLKKHIPYLTDIEITKQPSGFNGGVRNIFKGAITVRFRLYEKSVALLNCHMFAFMEMALNRDTEYWSFMCDQSFADPQAEELYHHDYIFWSGDLNYRIEHDNNETRAAIKSDKHVDLLQYDQLKYQKENGLAFVGFNEGDITFAPTYKFDIGTDTYDTSEKNRTPAWCDRVLWSARAEREIAASTVDWGELEETDSDSMSSNISDDEVKKTKKKTKKVKCDCNAPEDKRIAMLRRRTLGLMRKMSTLTSSALLSSTTALSDKIQFHKTDLTDSKELHELLENIKKKTKESGLIDKSVEVVEYRGHPEFLCSDHKPVTATLSVHFDVDSAKQKVKFEKESYSWESNKPLKVKLVGHDPRESGDKISIVKSDWVSLDADELSCISVSAKDVLIIPASHFPAEDESLELVYYSEERSAPVAIVKVNCVEGTSSACCIPCTGTSKTKYKAVDQK